MNTETQSGQQPDKGIANMGERDFAELTSDKPAQTQESQQTQQTQQAPAQETQQVQQTQQTPAATAVPAVTPPATPTYDQKVLESVVEAAVRGVRQPQPIQQPTAEPQISEEEFNKKYGIPTITEAHIASILDQDPKKAAAALNNILRSVTAASVRMANDLSAAELSKVRGEVEPHLKSWQTYQAEVREQQTIKQFYTEYKDLTGEEDLVNTVKDALIAKVQSGEIRFASQKDANLAVATGVRSILARMNKTAAGATVSGTTQNTQTTGQTTGRQMSAASSAGRSGTGQATPKSDAEQIFGEDAR